MLVNNSKSRILYGSDPESFAGYFRGNSLFALPPYYFREVLKVPIVEQDERHPVFIATDSFKVHEDGAAFEFSVTPSHNPKELFDRIQEAARATSEKILQYFPDACLPSLQFIPTIGWDVERWTGMPEDFFMSTLFGCDVDKDVFDLTAKPREVDASKHPERYGGGHFHFSGSPRIAEDPHQAVRCQVVTTGCAAILYSPWPDLEHKRTYLYGKPGKFREQNYGRNNPFGISYARGIEYRTPSATWANSWEIAQNVFRWAEIGIHALLETSLGDEIVPTVIETAKEAIITADKDKASQVLSYIESKL